MRLMNLLEQDKRSLPTLPDEADKVIACLKESEKPISYSQLLKIDVHRIHYVGAAITRLASGGVISTVDASAIDPEYILASDWEQRLVDYKERMIPRESGSYSFEQVVDSRTHWEEALSFIEAKDVGLVVNALKKSSFAIPFATLVNLETSRAGILSAIIHQLEERGALTFTGIAEDVLREYSLVDGWQSKVAGYLRDLGTPPVTTSGDISVDKEAQQDAVNHMVRKSDVNKIMTLLCDSTRPVPSYQFLNLDTRRPHVINAAMQQMQRRGIVRCIGDDTLMKGEYALVNGWQEKLEAYMGSLDS